MTINSINDFRSQVETRGEKQEMKKEPASPVSSDCVSLGQGGKDDLKLIIGAPTGRLAPEMYPVNVHPNPIAIEIKDGVGIGIDGESIIVTPGKAGTIEVIGRHEDGTGIQRDYKVTRNEKEAVVDGHYDWQDYKITREGDTMRIAGETDRETYDVEWKGNQTTISGKWPVQNFKIDSTKNTANVDGWETMYDSKIVREGNVTTIKGDIPERSFVITHGENKMKVDGKYAFQDFDITWNEKEIVITSCYPHQKHIIRFKDA